MSRAWTMAAMHDAQGRRGIWFRERDDGCLEVCGGREGDDYIVRFRAGQAPSESDLRMLFDILDTSAWVLGESRPEVADTQPSCGDGKHPEDLWMPG